MADKLRVYSTTLFSTLTRLEGVWRGFAVLLMLAFAASAGWAQGLQTPRDCPLSNGTTVKAYLCLDDIIVVDGSGSDGVPAPGFPYGKSVGGLYLVNPSTGDQTVITSGGKLSQASSVAMEPATGKLLAVSRTYGIIRVDPKDGSQQVLLKGGTGWGTGFPTLSDQTIASDRARNAEMFIYPAAIVIDAVSNILVTDTGINLFDRKLKSDPADPSVPNCTDPKDVRTCESFPGKIIRLRKKLGEGPGIYEVPEVVATGGDVANSKLLSDPFDIAVTNAGNIYVTDMNATLGNTDPTKGPTDPGLGGIIFLDAANGYKQSTFFSSYSVNANSLGCPMGITIDSTGKVIASVFSYNGYGCAPAGVFVLTPDPFGAQPPNLATTISGSPFQYPFGMDIDRGDGQGGQPRIIIADEGSGYGCAGTIFRLDLTKPIVRSGSLSDLNPFALSPIAGGGCTPPNQTLLVTPADVVVVKVAVSINIPTNTPPSNVNVSMSPSPINEGSTASLSGSFVDPDTSDTHTVTITWGDGSADTVLSLGAGVVSIPATAHQYLDNRPSNAAYTVNVSVIDGGTTSVSGSATVTVNNVAPVITAVSGPSGAVKISDPVTIVSSFTDVGTRDTHSCSVAWGDGSTTGGSVSETNGSGSCTAIHSYTGSGTFTVGVSVTDKDGGSGTNSGLQVRVNTPPVVSSITGPAAPMISGSAATVKASFTDVDTLDIHTCSVTWGDRQTSAGTVTETNGSGSCQATHTYTSAGVFSVGVTVADNIGEAATKTFQYVVIFDPTEGSVRGSGSFKSPAGAFAYDPTLQGTPTFAFSVAYAKGAVVPTGYKQFEYTDGNLHFYSETINWLVISGATAQFQGNTDVNADARVWTFLVTITDGAQVGGGGIDKIRVKLIDDAGLIVYDNVRGAPDDLNPANQQPISSGDIVVFLDTPPAVTGLTLDQTTINEGGTVNLTGTFTDPDAGQSHTVSLDWGDGTAPTTVSVSATSSNFAASHKYKDDPTGAPSFTITARVFDTFNAVGVGSTTVTVNNVAPVITTVTGPTTTVNTGANATIKVSFTDVGVLDTHTCAYAWGDGQTTSGTVTETSGSGSCTASHIYTATGGQTVTITVTDYDGGSVSSTFSLLVNTPPTVSPLSLSAATINEGEQTTVSGTFTDPDTSDTHTITINWGDGSANTSISLAAGTFNFSSTHKYKDNPAGTPSGGSFTIGVTVADNHSGKGIGNTSVTVNNVAPVIGTITKPSPAVILGSAASLKANFTDVGTLDTHTCTFALGDTQTASGSVTETNGSGSCSASYTYGAAGTYNVTVTVTDRDSAFVVSSSFSVVVDRPPAVSTLSFSATTINEGDQPTLTGAFTDPDSGDTHKITINWGDGTSNTIVNLAAGVFNFSANHKYLDNPAGQPAGGTFAVNVTVADNFGGSVPGSTSITVNNVAPILNVPANAVYGNSPGLTQTPWSPFTDKGTLDTHTCTYGWGDGTPDSTFPEASGVCSTPHTYAAAGTYTLTVTVVDKDGGSTGPKTFPMVVPGP